MAVSTPPMRAFGASSHVRPARTRSLPLQRADGESLAHLFRQHCHGALAPIDRPGYAQRGDGRSSNSGDRGQFSKVGDPRFFWTERVSARDEEISLTWYDIGEPLLIHTQPNANPARPYGVCTVLIPALGARLSRNGLQANGSAWPREREGRLFSTCALAFSESWTESR
jgi:hypothetical protein